MRFAATLTTLAVFLAPSVFAQDTTVTDASTTTITRTVVQATATSTIVRSSGASGPSETSETAVSTSTSVKPTSTAIAATPSADTVPSEYMAGGTKEQSSLVVVAMAGVAVIAFGL